MATPATLVPGDDDFHPPTLDDPYWTETHWFSFDQPGPNLSCSVYPVLRRNLNIASVALYLWDGSESAPWLIRYGKAYWHLPFPESGLRQLRLGDLEYDCIEPLLSWAVRYADGEQVALDLRWDGLREAHLAHKSPHGGHLDQPCRVTGTVTIDGERYDIDTLGMRDKSWGVRPDVRAGVAAEDGRSAVAYTYGTLSADEQFLIYSAMKGNVGDAMPGGYLVRGGEKSAIVRGTRRVLGRSSGYPTEIELVIEDDLGRTLKVHGICQNRLAKQAFSTTFAWLSMTEWRTPDGERFLGEDQEVFSPYSSGARMARLNTR